jgi:SAM-dependent methyltransferase
MIERRHAHRWQIIAGAAFMAAAAGWLLVNEQRRRLRVAAIRTMRGWPPGVRAHVSEIWRWWLNGWVDPWGRYRRQLAREATGAVLEVGVGTWPNMIYYEQAERLVGVEQNRRQVFAARRRMRRHRPQTVIVHASSRKLPFADATFDTVVTSLALCSVSDQAAALAEMRRVLRPGGTLRFLEHVRGEQRWVALSQTVLTPLWFAFASGCHLNRDTLAAVQAAGFEIVALERVTGAWGPARPTIRGIARRPSSCADEIAQ